MAMQPICNLTLAALLALGAAGTLFAQDESRGQRADAEGRSLEGRSQGQGRGTGQARAARGEGSGQGARRSSNADGQGAGPARTVTAAVPLPAPAERSWLDEIAELEVQTTLLEKRDDLASRRIDSQIRLKQKRTELDALERESTDEMLAYLPQVVSVIGTKGKYQCQLFFPSGRTSYARTGDTIAPGVSVKSISPSGVEVDVLMGALSERRQVPLGFVSLAERRGETEGSGNGEGAALNPGEIFRNIFGPRPAGAAPRPAAPAAPAGARAAGARGAAANGGN